MAHNSRVRAPGLWVDGGALLAAEMEALDASQEEAINGDQGGVWAPAAQIELGGAGLKVTGAAVFTGGVTANTLTVTGATALQAGAAVTGGNFSVSQDASVQGELTVDGATSLNGGATVTGGDLVADDLSVVNDADVQGNLTAGVAGFGGAVEGGFKLKVTGAAKVTGALTVGGLGTFDSAQVTGGFQVAGLGTFAGGVSVTAASTLTAPVTTSGTGRVRRRTAIGADANTTYNIGDADVILVRPGDLSATRSYTLGTTGAAAGDVIRFCSRHASQIVNILVPSNLSEERDIGLDPLQDNWLEYTFFADGKWWLTGLFTNP